MTSDASLPRAIGASCRRPLRPPTRLPSGKPSQFPAKHLIDSIRPSRIPHSLFNVCLHSQNAPRPCVILREWKALFKPSSLASSPFLQTH